MFVSVGGGRAHLLDLRLLVADGLAEVSALRVGGEQLQPDGAGEALGLLELLVPLLQRRVGQAEPLQQILVLLLLLSRRDRDRQG